MTDGYEEALGHYFVARSIGAAAGETIGTALIAANPMPTMPAAKNLTYAEVKTATAEYSRALTRWRVRDSERRAILNIHSNQKGK